MEWELKCLQRKSVDGRHGRVGRRCCAGRDRWRWLSASTSDDMVVDLLEMMWCGRGGVKSRVAPRMRSALAKRKLPMVGSDVLVVSACLGHCLLCFERSGSKTEINTRLPLGDTPAPSVVSLVAQKDPGSTACLLLLTHSVSHSQSVNSEYTKY